MARRRNKKNIKSASAQQGEKKGTGERKSAAPPSAPEAAKTSQPKEIPTVRTKPEKAFKSVKGISATTCMAGMFLSLILGVYLGTLLPEALREKEKSQPVAMVDPAPQPKAPAPVNDRPGNPIPADLANSISGLEAALRKNPDSAADWTSLGNLYFDVGEHAKAVHAYEHSLKLAPENPDVWTDLGIMRRELHEYEKAVECFREATRINPRHANALFNEGVVLAYDLRDKQGAKRAWERLISVNPAARTPSGTPVSQLIEELR